MKHRRTFECESEFKEVRYGKNKVQKGIFFVFNDSVLIAEKKSKDKYKVLDEAVLDQDSLIEDKDSTGESKSRLQLCF